MKCTVQVALIILSIVFPLVAQSQESIEEQIKNHLDKLPDNRYQMIVSSDSLVRIPDSAKRDLRFEFQKRMALTGHGVLYDVEGREVVLDTDDILRLQSEMLNAVRKEQSDPFEGLKVRQQQNELYEIIKALEGALRSGLKPADQFAAMNLLTRAEAARLEDTRSSEYRWRSNYLMSVSQRSYKLDDLSLMVVELDHWFRDWWLTWLGSQTDYMNQCAAEDVPVPPNFSTNSTEWNFQGQLTTKLIAANDDANVWTWHEPGERGACVALPRGTGGPGSLAGIICQSATTGKACFWDNLPRGSSTRIEWATETLVIEDLQDGSVLSENCTNCHQGNNVFLVSPEDPTWCRLLRGQTSAACAPIDGTDIANFTLAVEAAVDTVNVPNTSIHHSRYMPLSGSPPRAGWDNTETIGCGGACHLGGSAVTPPPMPPACGVDCY